MRWTATDKAAGTRQWATTEKRGGHPHDEVVFHVHHVLEGLPAVGGGPGAGRETLLTLLAATRGDQGHGVGEQSMCCQGAGFPISTPLGLTC